MIQLEITKTARGYSKKETFHIFDNQNKTFSDMQSARKWICDQYGKAKRSPMYIDGKDGKPQKIGYVIGFRNADLSHYPVDKWIQRDWIEFNEIKRTILQPLTRKEGREMKIINGEERLTRDEARTAVERMADRWGANQTTATDGLSYRRDGVPGTGGGTIAISYIPKEIRRGVRYYKEIPYAS